MEIPRDLLNIIKHYTVIQNARDCFVDNIIDRGVSCIYDRDNGRIIINILLEGRNDGKTDFDINYDIELRVTDRGILYDNNLGTSPYKNLYNKKSRSFVFAIYGDRGVVLKVSINKEKMADIIVGYYSKKDSAVGLLTANAANYLSCGIKSILNYTFYCDWISYVPKVIYDPYLKSIHSYEFYLVSDKYYEIVIECPWVLYDAGSRTDKYFYAKNQLANIGISENAIRARGGLYLEETTKGGRFGMLIRYFCDK